ncbi:hypothetical protein ACJX0J_007743, partial [Zea mays]
GQNKENALHNDQLESLLIVIHYFFIESCYSMVEVQDVYVSSNGQPSLFSLILYIEIFLDNSIKVMFAIEPDMMIGGHEEEVILLYVGVSLV